MLWKLLGLQKRFDALFEDGWIRPGFVCTSGVFFDDLVEAFALVEAQTSLHP
jgi:hypothetical protein